MVIGASAGSADGRLKRAWCVKTEGKSIIEILDPQLPHAIDYEARRGTVPVICLGWL
jgi:hypothetical protein